MSWEVALPSTVTASTMVTLTAGFCRLTVKLMVPSSTLATVSSMYTGKSLSWISTSTVFSVTHSTTPEIATEVAEDLRDLLPAVAESYVTRFGPVLGVYTGPGAIGIALLQVGE